MIPPTFSTVRSTRTLAQADLLVGILRSAGLHPLDLETFGHFTLAGADIEYAIRVPTAELAEACDVLSQQDASAV